MTRTTDLTQTLSGCYTALLTPFRDGQLDEPALRALVERQIVGGVSGLVPCGTTGEAPSLTATEWHRVVIFSEGLVRVAEQYLRKGSKVYIEGALQTRKWQDQNGQDKYSTEVVLQGFNSTLTMLDGRGDNEGAPGGFSGPRESSSFGGGRQESRRPSSAPAFESGSMDDDIPF